MFYTDHRAPAQRYRERLQEAAQERLALATLRAQRQVAKPTPSASRLPRFVRLFGRRSAAAGQL